MSCAKISDHAAFFPFLGRVGCWCGYCAGDCWDVGAAGVVVRGAVAVGVGGCDVDDYGSGWHACGGVGAGDASVAFGGDGAFGG